MKVSYEWLQSYFKDPLPAPERLTELFTFHLAEVESVEKVGEDTVFDIKILPDRACYALSVRGVARELAAILDLPINEGEIRSVQEEASVPDPEINIENSELCTKFVSRRIENVQVSDSPEWMRRRLAAIGQRSINNLVDATNYIMFGLGRPMHAFDVDKVKGPLVVRSAQPGEILITLDNKRVELSATHLIIADDEGPLALAGIKGGKRAEVDANTKNIILESANWNATNIRRTATATGVRTEASKRFENRTPPLLAEEGIEHITPLIIDIASTDETKVGRIYSLSSELLEEKTIVVDPEEISRKLGIPLGEKEVVNVLQRLRIKSEKKDKELWLSIPDDRLDLTMTDDIVEEVGRILGYDQVPLVVPSPPSLPLGITKQLYWEWRVREILLQEGFSEIMTSSFLSTGEVAIEKPLAKDKGFCRPNLRGSFEPALAANFLNAPLFGLEEVRLFEFGKVFPKSGEHTALAIGYAGPKKKVAGALAEILEKIAVRIGATFSSESKEGIFECDFDAIVLSLPEPKEWDVRVPESQSEKFLPFSRYPFIVRDIALFVPPEASVAEVLNAIRATAGELATRVWKFDEFEKDSKRSLAFRIVFQSFERTLTDDEVNVLMQKIEVALAEAFGAEVR